MIILKFFEEKQKDLCTEINILIVKKIEFIFSTF